MTFSLNLNTKEGWQMYLHDHWSSTFQYENWAKVGEGTYGEVFSCRKKKSKEVVAMKRLKIDDAPATAPIEVELLHRLDHPNIVRLLGICTGLTIRRCTNSFYMALEFCEYTLADFLRNPNFKMAFLEKLEVTHQLLSGINYLHANQILHRDIKPENILINSAGSVKIADFGMALELKKRQRDRFRLNVVSRWYRPPEILLGDADYGLPVDLWSVGCVLAELWMGRPLFQGENAFEQLIEIMQLCGSIGPEVWPNVIYLKYYGQLKIPMLYTRQLREVLGSTGIDNYSLGLIDRLLELDPSKRITSKEALKRISWPYVRTGHSLELMVRRHKQSMQHPLQLSPLGIRNN